MTGLLDEVTRRLVDRDLTDRVVSLAVAACHGAEAVAEALTSTPDLLVSDREALATPAAEVHLRSIRVAGFRGIGEPAVLDLPPGAGLTLVVGRNGSGKSSFAEAVEFTLTGDNQRWSKRSKVWRDGWRNLHHGDAPELSADFSVAGVTEPVTVRRRWESAAALDGHVCRVSGAGADASLDSLGWTSALDLYRPFLPYSELGAMVDEGPTALHDALSAVLGLDLLTAAAKVLQEARLIRERAWKAVVADGKALADDLATVDDGRAAQAAELLAAGKPDVGAIAALLGVEDTPGVDPGLEVLRQLATIPGPDLDAVRHAADRLDRAARAIRDTRGSDAARDLEVAGLLAAARRFRHDHGDADCPVCAVGRLDAAWAERAEQLEATLHEGARQVEELAETLASARRAVVALCRPVPPVLHRAGAGDLDARAAIKAWEALEVVAAEADDIERAVQLRKAADALTDVLATLRRDAKAGVAEREDLWRPAATRVAVWVHAAVQAQAATAPVADLKAAEVAVTDVLDAVRSERWTPIAAQARAIWERLRQSSNVSIEDVALTGSGNKRRVEVSVTVDDVEGAALGVMSQGELHALALSLFLPRATLGESPFRFLVIDDPVQSMDAARVDGLARVLQDVAQDRQVVVFTHDDRLPEAVRRLQIPATVLEVTRATNSRVEVRHSSSPWQRHLDDARALARSEGLPDFLRQQTVPGFCRLAIEAACADAVRRRDLGAGQAHAAVEADLEAATKLLPRLALALFGDAGRGGEVYGHLQRRVGPWAADLVRTCNEGTHKGSTGDLPKLVEEVEELLTKAGLASTRASTS